MATELRPASRAAPRACRAVARSSAWISSPRAPTRPCTSSTWLWSGAGFDARYGSFADPSGYDWDEHDIGCSTTGKYYLADCEGAPCVFEDFDDTYDAICTCPYVESFMNATVDTRKIRRSTAKNCREIASAHGSCAVQETLNSGELMADYDAMKTLHGYIADADFRTGGTECKTHSDDDS